MRRYARSLLLGGLAVAVGTPALLAQEQEVEGSAMVVGVVRNGEEPLPGVDVRIANSQIASTTDEEGAFALEGIPPGPRIVTLHYKDANKVVGKLTLQPEQVVRLVILVQNDPTPLAAIRASVVDPRRRLAGFYKRKEQGRGVYLTREDFKDKKQMSDVFRGISGLRIQSCVTPAGEAISGCYRVVTGRQAPSLSSGSGDCQPLYYVNGGRAPIDNLPQGINEFRPEDMEAIEIYRSGGAVPAQYGGSNARCGVILFWTRGG
ncbi:MAG: carboxypeptidase-like regulatory domain-containing protein [Gemmatimonadota bacterium]